MDGKSVFGYKPRFFFNLNLGKTYIISIMRSCLNAPISYLFGVVNNAPTHTYSFKCETQTQCLRNHFSSLIIVG